MTEQRRQMLVIKALASLRPHYAIILFILVYAVLGVSGLNALHNWGGDFAHYIFQARAILETGALVDPDFVHNPKVSPAVVPPVFTLMLVPFYAVFGVDLFWLKVPAFAGLCFGLVTVYLFVNRTHSRGIALATVAVFALMPFVWVYRQQILTEFPFIFLTFAALYLNERRCSDRAKHDIANSIVVGIVLFVVFMTRQIGLILFVAVLLSDMSRLDGRRRLTSLLTLCGAFAVLFAAFSWLIFDPTYYPDVETFCLRCLSRNLIGYYIPITGIFFGIGYGPSPYHIADILAGSVLLLVAAGIALRFQAAFRRQPRHIAIWLRLVRMFSAAEWYFGGTLIFLLLLPFGEPSRYLLPLLPLAIFYIFVALQALTACVRYCRRGWAVIAVAMGSIYLAQDYYVLRRADPAQLMGPAATDAQPLFGYIRENVGENDLIMVGKPRVFVLLTRRRATFWNNDVSLDNLLDDVRARGITHLIVGKRWSGLSTKSWMVNAPAIRKNFDIVYEDSLFRILKYAP